MYHTKENKILNIFKKKSMWIIIFLVMLGLSITIGVITYYGQQVGSFVVGVTDDSYYGGLTLSEDETFEVKGPRLVGDAISDVDPMTLLNIYIDKVKQTNGTYISNSGNYMGYTFYLKNEGNISVNIDLSLEISKATKNLDKACWLWLFDGQDDDRGIIYKAKDEVNFNYPDEYDDYEIENFVDDETILQRRYLYFEPLEVRKFTIIMWVEGHDPDCTDVGEKSILEGLIRFSMRFDIISEDEFEESAGEL